MGIPIQLQRQPACRPTPIIQVTSFESRGINGQDKDKVQRNILTVYAVGNCSFNVRNSDLRKVSNLCQGSWFWGCWEC
jgi:hypothetical protein